MLRYCICLLALVACSTPQNDDPVKKTQDEIRQMQSRQYDTKDTKRILKTLLSVLQEDNYIVRNSALDLGFFTATKETDIQSANADLWAKLQRTDAVKWPKCECIEATVNVSEFGSGTRVRTNFQSKILDNTGAIVSVKQITDEKFYQDFFNNVQQTQNM